MLAFRLREYFQPLRWIRGPTSASMTFRLRAEIPATVLEDACRLEIVDELEIDDVYDYAESIVGAAAELRLIAARDVLRFARATRAGARDARAGRCARTASGRLGLPNGRPSSRP